MNAFDGENEKLDSQHESMCDYAYSSIPDLLTVWFEELGSIYGKELSTLQMARVTFQCCAFHLSIAEQYYAAKSCDRRKPCVQALIDTMLAILGEFYPLDSDEELLHKGQEMVKVFSYYHGLMLQPFVETPSPHGTRSQKDRLRKIMTTGKIPRETVSYFVNLLDNQAFEAMRICEMLPTQMLEPKTSDVMKTQLRHFSEFVTMTLEVNANILIHMAVVSAMARTLPNYLRLLDDISVLKR